MNCIKYIFTLCLFTGSLMLFAQQGKDGAKSISANTIVNEYIDVTTKIDSGDVSIKVSLSSLNANSRFSGPLAAGDLIFIYQTRGATIKGQDVVAWGGNGNPRDRTMGEILNYNNTGHYEFAEVKSVPDGTTIQLSCPATKFYSAGLGQTQVIRVPRYSSLTITGTGILTAQGWNGTTGGVQVTEVKGNTTISAGGKIDVSGLGFMGGVAVNIAELPSNNEGTNDHRYGADKGEGVSGYKQEYDTILWNNNGNDGGGRYGKNSMANGGGGGCSIDGGGGGGANGGNPALWCGRGVPDHSSNYDLAWALENASIPSLTSTNSSGGGKGGYAYANTAKDPMLVGPHTASWGGDQRDTAGGLGGRPLDYSKGAIYLGGGGGAGQGDNTYAGSGGNGGGLIYLLCFGNVSGSGQIISNGNNGANAQGTPNINVLTGKDGAGGGGAGGTIIINSTVSGITATANGGKGGDQNMVHGALSGGWEAQGPGGGGGGGYIAVQSGAITEQVNGGANGITNSQIVVPASGNKFPPNGATSGGTGSMNQVITNYFISVRDTAICGSGSLTLPASLTGTLPAGGAILTWYDAAIGGNVLTTGTSYTTPVLNATTTYYVGTCPGFYRVPIKVTVGAALTATLTPTAATCASGGSVTVALSGGTAAFTYTWSNGSTNATLSNVAAATYTVTVKDAGGCSATSTATVAAAATINVSSSTATNLTCNGQSTGSIVMNPSGGNPAYTYTWSNAATTQTISGLAAASYTVTVTDASGCTAVSTVTLTQPAAITVPTFTTANAGCSVSTGSAIATSSGGTGALTYTWSNSASGQTNSGLAAASYTVTVNDANACTKTAVATIGTTSGGTATTSVQSNVSCKGSSTGNASVTPAGGTPNYTYSWSNATTGQTATTLAAGLYTVTVTDAAGCVATSTVNITEPASAVNTPTFTIAPAGCTVNNGSAIVTASGGTGALTYTWSNTVSGQTNSGLAAASYTVTVKDANGCTKSAVAVVGTAGSGTATTSVQSNVKCNSGNTGAATVTAGGGTPGYTYSWSNASTGQTASTLIAGPYTVTVTDAAGCTATSTVNITEPGAITTPTFVTGNASCGISNGTATATASGGTGALTYTWSNAVSGQTNNGLAAASYTVTVTDANACTKSAVAVVGNTGGGTATTSITSNVSCKGGNNGSATVTATGGTPNYTYSWSTGQTGVTGITGLTAATYVVSVTDALGCTAVSSVIITEPNAINAPTFTITNASCGANNGSVTATTSGGTGTLTYTWSNAISGQTNAGIAAGPYTLTVTDANGCTTSSTATVGSAGGGTANASVQSNVSCNGGNNGSASVVAGGGTPNYTYSWSNAATGQTISGVVAGPYTVTVTDASGCTATSSVTITEPVAITTPTFVTGNASCGVSNGTATATSSGGIGTLTYTWSNAASGQTNAGLAAASYTVTVTDGNGCTRSAVAVVGNTGGSTATTSVQSNVSCKGGSTGSASVVAAGGTPGYTYSWSNGASGVTGITGLTAGTYVVSVTDAVGCTAVSSVIITEPASAVSTPTFTIVKAGCAASNGSATATTSGGTGALTYTWSNAVSGQTNAGLAAASYTLTVTDANGCTTSAVAAVGNAGGGTATTSIQSNVSCNGGNTGVAAVNLSGGTPNYTYSWSNAASGQTVSGLVAGPYTVTVTDASGCIATSTVNITEPSALLATSASSSTCGASSGSATVTATGGSSAYSFNWSAPGGTAQTATGLSSGTYTCTVTDANGCTKITVVNVVAKTVPSISAGANISINSGSTSVLTPTSSSSYTYQWSPPDGLSCTNCENPVANPVVKTIYCVQVTDTNGCSANSCVTVDVRCGELFTPSAFSPDGNTQNDIYYVRGGCVKTLSFTVFNRWGEKVFETTNQANGWDGTYKGQACSADVYNYYLNATMYDGSIVTRKGNITLVK